MNLDQYEDNFFRMKKQTTNMLFDQKDCVNSFNLPSKKIFEVKSGGNISCLDLSLSWVSKAQKNGICVMVDSEFNCWLDKMKKHNINLSELLYVPCSEPNENYHILYKLLEIKEIHLIVLNSISLIFPLVYDIKQFTTDFTKLKEAVQESEASIIILNPYHDLHYDIFNKTISCQFQTKYEKRNEYGVKIDVKMKDFTGFMKNESFTEDIAYIK